MIIRTKYRQIEFIGLYYLLYKDLFFAPFAAKVKLPDKQRIDLSAYQSDMIGHYYIAKQGFFFYPHTITEDEKKAIQGLKEYDLEPVEIRTRKNSLANNLVVDEKIILTNPNMEKSVKQNLQDITGKEVMDYELLGYKTIGSVLVTNKHGFLVHYKTPPEEIEKLEELLGKPGVPTTANMGVPFLNISMVASDDTVLLGKKTTGIEEMKVRRALLPPQSHTSSSSD